MSVELLKYPQQSDWEMCKLLTLNTIGKKYTGSTVTDEWKRKILQAGHSPIRSLVFIFRLEIPYWVSVHLVRHKIGVEHFVQSQRNDRQNNYDRTKAPQDAMVSHCIMLNAESLITLCHKRLCMQASPETRAVVAEMKRQVLAVCPEFEGLLVPLCEYRNGKCTEFKPCGRYA